LGVIFVGDRVAEIDEQTVAKQLSDMPIVASNHLRTGGLVGMDHFPVLFGVELAGEFGGVHQVTKHHSELPTFRFGSRRGSNARCDLRGGLLLGSRRLCWLSSLRGYGRGFCSVPSPHEYSAIFIRGELLCFNDLRLEGFEILVVEAEPYLEGWI
jgi:hypothetical protein